MNKWIAGLLFVIVLMGGCGSKTISENGGSKGNSAQAGNTAQNNTMITGKPESNQSNVQNEVPDPITPAVGESAGSKDEPSELPAQNTPVPEASFLYPVMKDDKWGYIDAEGNLVIDYKFDYAGFFTDGAATVRIGGKESLMAPDGKFLIEPAYDFCGNYSEGLAHVVLGEDGKSRHGFADLTGRVFFRDYFNKIPAASTMAWPALKKTASSVMSILKAILSLNLLMILHMIFPKGLQWSPTWTNAGSSI